MTKSKACTYAKAGYRLGTDWPLGSFTLAYLKYTDEQFDREFHNNNGIGTLLGEGIIRLCALGFAIVPGAIDLGSIPIRCTAASIGFLWGGVKDARVQQKPAYSPPVSNDNRRILGSF